MRILIVDDEDEALRAMERFLSRTDVEILPTHDSAQAAQLITTEHFDGMLIDYLMPGLDGLELVSTARRSQANRETPIIIVTGYDDMDTRNKAAKAGATCFLAKPFTPDKIRRVLWAALKNHDSSQAPSAEITREFVAF